MHGPYRARVRVGSGSPFELDADEVRAGERIADRFYRPEGRGTLVGFTRAATFTAGILLDPGERAEVEIIGRSGPETGSIPCGASARGGSHEGCYWCEGTGRIRARDETARVESVRRLDDGSLSTTLGSRFRERVFRGV